MDMSSTLFVFLKNANITMSVNFYMMFNHPNESIFDWIYPTIAEWTITPTSNLFQAVILDTNLANRSHVSLVNCVLISWSCFTYKALHYDLPLESFKRTSFV